jgi:hypothetical protein
MYHLFCGEIYYPYGGMSDYVGVFSSLDECRDARRGQWAQVAQVQQEQLHVVVQWYRELGDDQWKPER